jgi:hypothetical protein
MKKLVIALCAMVALFGMTSCGSSSSPSGVVKAYHDALKSGKYEKAVSYTVLTDQKDIEEYAAKLEGYQYKVLDYEILSETISDDGETAVVEMKRTTTSKLNQEPKEVTDKVNLKKVDGKWKIRI